MVNIKINILRCTVSKIYKKINDQVYVPLLPASIPELKVRIRTAIETITADMLQTAGKELDYRVDVCRVINGAHIEHLKGM